MLDICLLGTGGMMPLSLPLAHIHDGRCAAAIFLSTAGKAQIALKEKGWSPKPIDVICFAIIMPDHISGLPGPSSDYKCKAYRTADIDPDQRDWNVW